MPKPPKKPAESNVTPFPKMKKARVQEGGELTIGIGILEMYLDEDDLVFITPDGDEGRTVLGEYAEPSSRMVARSDGEAALDTVDISLPVRLAGKLTKRCPKCRRRMIKRYLARHPVREGDKCSTRWWCACGSVEITGFEDSPSGSELDLRWWMEINGGDEPAR